MINCLSTFIRIPIEVSGQATDGVIWVLETGTEGYNGELLLLERDPSSGHCRLALDKLGNAVPDLEQKCQRQDGMDEDFQNLKALHFGTN